jgi:hypothetical protein
MDAETVRGDWSAFGKKYFRLVRIQRVYGSNREFKTNARLENLKNWPEDEMGEVMARFLGDARKMKWLSSGSRSRPSTLSGLMRQSDMWK